MPFSYPVTPKVTTMPQAVVDPDEMREFARALKKFNDDLRDRASRMSNHLNALSATWRDQEHKKFSQQFEEHVKLLGRFLETSEQHVPYLMRKADQVDEYLQS